MDQTLPREVHFSSKDAIVRSKVPDVIGEHLDTYKRFMTGVRVVILFHLVLITAVAVVFVLHLSWIVAAFLAALELWGGFTFISRVWSSPI